MGKSKLKPQVKDNVVDATLLFHVRSFSDEQLERALWFSRMTDSMMESESMLVVKTPLDDAMEKEYSRRAIEKNRMYMLYIEYGVEIAAEDVPVEPCVVLPFKRSNHV